MHGDYWLAYFCRYMEKDRSTSADYVTDRRLLKIRIKNNTIIKFEYLNLLLIGTSTDIVVIAA